MDKVRLYIISDNPDEALAYTLGCAETNRPSWCRVVSDPVEILRIPDGAKCQAVFFTSRVRTSDAEWAWRQRRYDMGGTKHLSDEDRTWLAEWIARRRATMAHGPDLSAAPADNAPNPPAMAQAPPAEIKNLILTQRWT